MKETLEIIRYALSSKDERGWVVRPICNEFNDFVVRDDDEGLGDVRNLHIVSMVPGSTRGDHFHKHQREFLLIMGGKVELQWQNPGEEEKKKEIMDAHEPILLRVPPNTIHSIKNISNEVLYVVCYSRAYAPYPGQDVHKVKGFSG